MTDHDTTRLAHLGRQRRKLLRDLADNRAEMNPLVVAAVEAGVRQARVVELSGHTREAIRKICRAAGMKKEKS